MELSKYQNEIIQYFENNPHSNMVVHALAGTGKSTLLQLLTSRTKTSDIYIAFNSSIAEEFKTKITNPKTKVSTLHSLAYGIMRYNYQNKNNLTTNAIGANRGIGSRNSFTQNNDIKLDNFKIHKIIDEIIKRQMNYMVPFDKRLFLKENYVQLYNLIRLTKSDINSQYISRLVEDYHLFVDYTDNHFPVPSVDTMIIWLRQINKKDMEYFDTHGIIDFTDMLYLTYVKLESKEWEIPYWDYFTNILVDEAQDLSTLQIFFLTKIKRRGGRYVFVMDTHQAIYSFAGANAFSNKLIEKVYKPIASFSLPINYRCPSSHLLQVRDMFQIPILPRKNAPVGDIYHIDKNEISNYIKTGDMVISRKNKWLSDVILDLTNNNIPIYIQDKDMVKSVCNIIEKSPSNSLYELRLYLRQIIKNYQKTIETTEDNILNHVNDMTDTETMMEVRSTNSKIDNIKFILSILGHYFNHMTISTNNKKSFLSYLQNLLNTSNSANCVRVCSIHKAKGLEADNVFVLNEAKVCIDKRKSWEQNEQEKNLSYIAMTRARETLYLVREEDVDE